MSIQVHFTLLLHGNIKNREINVEIITDDAVFKGSGKESKEIIIDLSPK